MEDSAWRHNKPWTTAEKYMLLRQMYSINEQTGFYNLVDQWSRTMRRIPDAIICRLRVMRLLNSTEDGLVIDYRRRVENLMAKLRYKYPGIERSRLVFDPDGSVTVLNEGSSLVSDPQSPDGAYQKAIIMGQGLYKLEIPGQFVGNIKSKEQEMKVEVKHFLNGHDIATLSDDELFAAIAQAEQEIEKLEAVKNKPKRLEARIASLKEALESLIKHLDGVDDAK